MAHDLHGRSFISLADFTPEAIQWLLDTAYDLKLRALSGEHPPLLAGKNLAMIFHKPSTRTRVSFEVAMEQLGGHALYLSAAEMQLGRGETIADTARVLSRFVDGILIRTFAHQDVVDLATAASVPVINGLTDLLHPTQALADLLTLREKFGHLAGLRLAYVGDGNNMLHSLLLGGALMGLQVAAATPAGHDPDRQVVARARELATRYGASIQLSHEPAEAVQGANAVYTDTWTSMGQEEERAARLRSFAGYQVDEALMAQAAPGAVFMHCLPAHRGEEVAAAVIDGASSVVFDEAENRLHAHRAILACLL